jgi:hypothetical protein
VTIETVGGRPARYPTRQIIQCLLVAAIAGGFLWLVVIYGNGLRDPRYLDGWVLTGGMAVQVLFHVALKTSGLSPKSASRWRKLHIFVGYLLIAAFLSHSDFSLPDTGFEWALWTGFVLVTVSGIFGTYLAWSLKAKCRIAEGLSYDRIPALRAELAQNVRAVVAETDESAAQIALPGLPHDAWIEDLYANHLHDFFNAPRNFSAHLVGSQRPLKLLTDEIDKLSRYVDQQSRDRLVTIKNLVIEKDRLDFARVYLGLTRIWLMVHVPVTYALIVLTAVHVIVAYSFSSGAW